MFVCIHIWICLSVYLSFQSQGFKGIEVVKHNWKLCDEYEREKVFKASWEFERSIFNGRKEEWRKRRRKEWSFRSLQEIWKLIDKNGDATVLTNHSYLPLYFHPSYYGTYLSLNLSIHWTNSTDNWISESRDVKQDLDLVYGTSSRE